MRQILVRAGKSKIPVSLILPQLVTCYQHHLNMWLSSTFHFNRLLHSSYYTLSSILSHSNWIIFLGSIPHWSFTFPPFDVPNSHILLYWNGFQKRHCFQYIKFMFQPFSVDSINLQNINYHTASSLAFIKSFFLIPCPTPGLFISNFSAQRTQSINVSGILSYFSPCTIFFLISLTHTICLDLFR